MNSIIWLEMVCDMQSFALSLFEEKLVEVVDDKITKIMKRREDLK